ncbi:MAG TPA: DNA-binding response regulator [Flavobacteriales bacterium]|nr:DNA-binding response regulator [Flavobacteriales bacterium]
MKSPKILLVDDDEDILEFLHYNLEKEDFKTTTASSGKQALKEVENEQFDLIILDVMMPHMDGIETCQKIREMANAEETIILFLTARGEDYSQIAGFEAGADDYITKPIRPKVFVSKINALLRRNSKKMSGAKSDGPFSVDWEKYLVHKNGKEISLPKKEFELAALLISKPGNVFGRDSILDKIWGEDVVVGNRTIDVHMQKIRKKLGKSYFKTIKGVGYKYVDH